MELLKVDTNLCVKCGLCAAACPNGIIGLSPEGPTMLCAAACIACGHCTAICPTKALDNEKAPLDKQAALETYPVITGKTAAAFLRARRSIRRYKKEKVAKEKILQLLDIARFAPTGCNSQGVSYIVIGNDEKLQKITAETVEWLAGRIADGTEWAKPFAGIIDIYRQQKVDIVLRNAPHLILAVAPKNFPLGHDNARLGLEYVELYATAMGLGTCWAGFAEMAAAAAEPGSPLASLMQIPEGFGVVGSMMLGYPQYTYKRLPDRNPLQVTWVD